MDFLAWCKSQVQRFIDNPPPGVQQALTKATPYHAALKVMSAKTEEEAARWMAIAYGREAAWKAVGVPPERDSVAVLASDATEYIATRDSAWQSGVQKAIEEQKSFTGDRP